MSRAFVKEPDGTEPFADAPGKLISEHPNYVTPKGLTLIEEQVRDFTVASAKSQANDDRAALSAAARELRYWQARLASAELVALPKHSSAVQFGATVTVRRGDGRIQRFQITGEDEADPKKGSISYVAPLALVLMGKQAGDVARLAGSEIEIVGLD